MPQIPYISTKEGRTEVSRILKRERWKLEEERDKILGSFPLLSEQQETQALWQKIDSELVRLTEQVTRQDVTGSCATAEGIDLLLAESLTAVNSQIKDEFFLLPFDVQGEAILHLKQLLLASNEGIVQRLQSSANDMLQLKIVLIALMQEHVQLQNLFDRCRPLQAQVEDASLPQDIEPHWKSVDREIVRLTNRLAYRTRWLADLQRHSENINGNSPG